MKIFLLLLMCSFVAHEGCAIVNQYPTRIVVAADGSGDYEILQEAIKSCKAFPDKRITIILKPGIYREKVEVFSWNPRISLIGESAATTVITFSDYSGKGEINTFTSWTFKVMGDDFYAENITFENGAGRVGQAVALHIEADRAVFRNCRFIGNQDTMYTGGTGSRQYFKDCYIEGTTDFIFGGATAVFEDCQIHSKENSYITAASTPEGSDYGYVLINCSLTAAPDVDKVYLGRPWRNYAKTVYLNCTMDKHIVPAGWHNWNKPEAEKTAFYAEYKSKGPGSSAENRVSWSHQLTNETAMKYSAGNVLAGRDQWNPEIR